MKKENFIFKTLKCKYFYLICALASIFLAVIWVFFNNSLLKYLSILFLFIGSLSPSSRQRTRFILFETGFAALFHFGGSFSFYTLSIAIFNIANLIEFIVCKKIDKHFFKNLSFYVAFILYAFIFALLNGTNATNIFSLINFSLYLSILFWVSMLFNKDIRFFDCKYLIFGFVLSMLITLPTFFSESLFDKFNFAYGSAHSIVQKTNFFGRFTAFIGMQIEPNFLGLQSIFCLTYFAIIYIKSGKLQLFEIVSVCICSISGLLTLSRTFIICFVLLLILVLDYRFKEKFKLSNIGLAIFVFLPALFSLLIFFVFTKIGFDYDTSDLRTFLSDFTTGRSDLLGLSFNEFIESPYTIIFGKGWNNIILRIDTHAAHNLVFDCFNAVGITGFVLLVAIFISFFKTTINCDKSTNLKVFLIFLIPLFLELMSLPTFGSWFFIYPAMLLPIYYFERSNITNEKNSINI